MNPTIHVIHDDLRTDRWELFLREAMEQEFEFKKWDACKENAKPITNISRCHKKIIQFAKDNNLEEICVAEDDVHFTAKGAWQYFLNNKPNDFDLYLSSIHGGGISSQNQTNSFSSLLCYIIHNRFYNTFLEANESEDIDRAMNGKGKFVVVNPFATIQAETFSDNTKRIHRQEKIYKNRKFFNG